MHMQHPIGIFCITLCNATLLYIYVRTHELIGFTHCISCYIVCNIYFNGIICCTLYPPVHLIFSLFSFYLDCRLRLTNYLNKQHFRLAQIVRQYCMGFTFILHTYYLNTYVSVHLNHFPNRNKSGVKLRRRCPRFIEFLARVGLKIFVYAASFGMGFLL